MVFSSFRLKLFLSSDHWKPVALGSWLLAFGFWLLAFGFWLLVEERPWPREVIFMDWALAPEVYWVYERLKAKS
jgi:hypothetical protein